MSVTVGRVLACLLACAVTLPAQAGALIDALIDGRVVADLRYRYERVDQDGFDRNARASTLRSRIGYETAPLAGFHAFVEFENVLAIGPERFNDVVSGRAGFPVVPDPEATELNQGFLAFQGLPATRVQVGRQRIILDNQRFVGNVGFRQNEQTFDAVTLQSGVVAPFTARYGFITNVNRVLGEDAAAGDFQTRTHYVNLAYEGLERNKIVGYGYFIDLDEVPTQSSLSLGVRLTGSRPFRFNRDLAITYAAEFAWQRDYADNPNDFSIYYGLLEPGISYRSVSARFGYEVLGSDGDDSFQTPLATLHAFQGVTDKFLVTPPDGIEDLYVKFAYLSDVREGPLSGVSFLASFHDFSAEEGDRDFGSEWAARLGKRFGDLPLVPGAVDLSVEYAFFDAEAISSDTHQLWLTAQYKF